MSLERSLARRKAKFMRDNPDGTVMIAGRPVAIISEAPDGERLIIRLCCPREIPPTDDVDQAIYFAIVATDFVRHVAGAFHIPESKMWEIVARERLLHPDATVKQLPDDYTELSDTKAEGGVQ